MKKILSSILAVIVVSLSLPHVAWATTEAENVKIDKLKYNLYSEEVDDGQENTSTVYTAEVKGFADGISDEDKSNLEILENVTYEGNTYSVTSIGYEAFYKCSSLTSVNIGNGVTSIGEYAFYDCSSLTSITIPDSVTSIDDFAFGKCTGLKTFFYGKKLRYIRKASVPETITKIAYTVNDDTSIPKKVTLTGVDLGEDDDGTDLTSIEISCNAMGEYYKITSVAEEISNKVALKPHNFPSEWTPDNNATCTQNGTKHKECSDCHAIIHEDNDEDPAKGHDYIETIVEPTETTLGGTHHVCSRCGDEYWDNFTKNDTYTQTMMPNG